MILFLDFDGVLHPIPRNGAELRFIPRLEAVLRDYPAVRIVISSMWRHDECHDLETLRSYFSDDIAARIIGVTPSIETPLKREYDFLEDVGFMLPQTRYNECVQWVKDNRYDGLWLCLDDAWREFPDPCRQLIRCETAIGFDAAVERVLRLRLQPLAESQDMQN